MVTGAAVLGALYVHYVPGLALLAAANLALAARHGWRDVLRLDVVVGAGLAPWAYYLVRSLGAWSRHGDGYAVAGGAAEYALKLAYWGMSFLVGARRRTSCWRRLSRWYRCSPGCSGRGRGGSGRCFGLGMVLAVDGFVGVGRWVSYPFIPARMLFVLPCVLALLAAGAAAHPRAGTAPVPACLRSRWRATGATSTGSAFATSSTPCRCARSRR